MLISQAAREAGANIETLRYYEQRGLLPHPGRRTSGYRVYGPDAVRVVRFIKRARELGFSLEEVGELIRLRGVAMRERHRVHAMAERKVADVDRKIEQLQAMRAALAALVHACHHRHAAACPIIEALNHD